MLIFDFDGVIVDSVDETAVTAYNAQTGHLVAGLSELPPVYLANFRKNRPLVHLAGNLPTLAAWCLQQETTQALDHQRWHLILNHEQRSLDERRELFFATRAKLFDRAPSSWFELNRPYQPLWDFLKAQDSTRIWILTFKNRKAVLDLCTHYGKDLIPEQILSGDAGTTKISNLQTLRHHVGEKAALSFVDDCVQNLQELQKALPTSQCPELFLANWGYVDPGDEALAHSQGYGVLSQELLMQMFPSL